MQCVTLLELFGGPGTSQRQAPYTKSVKVNIVAVDNIKTYINDKGEQRNYVVAGFADTTRAVKGLVYDEEKFSKLKTGTSMIVKNFIVKPDGNMVITNRTKLFPCIEVHTSEETRKAAVAIVKPEPAELKLLKEALESPTKTKVSVAGQIIQEEAACTVKVRNDDVTVKAIFVKDTSVPKCKVSLWRDAADANVRVGDYIKITDVITNSYKNETSLSTTSLTTIQKVDPPEQTTDLAISAIYVDAGNHIAEVLLSDDSDITIPLDILQEAFPEIDDIENYITANCNPVFNLKCTFKGGDVVKVSTTE